ncbi:MAG: MFS transporter [Lentisphaeria bacterium]
METLSPVLQKQGRNYFLLFNRFNGVSVACLFENIFILYSLKIGLPVYLTGILASFTFLTMPFMFLGKQFVAKIGAAKTIYVTWIMRNTVMLIAAFAPIAAMFNAPKVVVYAMVLVPCFLFFSCRSIGMIGFRPLQGEITTKQTRGRFVSQATLNTDAFYFIAMILQIIFVMLFPTIITFQLIIIVGCLFGFIAGAVMGKVPESDTPRLSARQPIFQATKLLLKQSRFRKLLYAQSAGQAIIMLVIPISMIALKKGYQVSDGMALCFAVIQILGGITMAFVNGIVSDRTGSRPLLLLYAFGMMCICGMWVTAPVSFSWTYMIILFFIGGCCLSGIGISFAHYFLNIAKDKDLVGGNLLLCAVAGITAGITGSVLVSMTLKTLGNYYLKNSLSLYKTYFGLAGIVTILLALIIIRLKPLRDWKIKKVIELFFSPRDMYALFDLYRMEELDSMEQDRSNVNHLAKLKSEISESTMLDFLASPSITLRWQALRGLRALNTLGLETEDAIIQEIEKGIYTTAYLAADIAGEKHIVKAIPVLRKSLDSLDFLLKSKAMLALGRLDDRESLPKIRDLFYKSDNPRMLIHGANAFSEYGDDCLIQDILQKFFASFQPAAIRNELLLAAAKIAGCPNTFYQFIKSLYHDRTAAINLLQDWKINKLENKKEILQILNDACKNDIKMEGENQKQILAMFAFDPKIQRVLTTIMQSAKQKDLTPELLAFLISLAATLQKKFLDSARKNE